ncbi:AtpZ/AtpI family protein [Mucilaginibacter sp. AW1-3]
MQSTPSPEEGNKGKQMNNLAKFTGIAFQMIAIIGVFAFAGYKIDQSAGHQTKWVTAILSLIGVFIAMYIVIRSLKP